MFVVFFFGAWVSADNINYRKSQTFLIVISICAKNPLLVGL